MTSCRPAVSVSKSPDPAEDFPFETASVLNTKVLVLNRAYLPIHITSVRRACSLLYQGVARAVDEQYQTFDFASWAALSASLQKSESIGLVDRAMRVPRVILLVAYDRVPKRQGPRDTGLSPSILANEPET